MHNKCYKKLLSACSCFTVSALSKQKIKGIQLFVVISLEYFKRSQRRTTERPVSFYNNEELKH